MQSNESRKASGIPAWSQHDAGSRLRFAVSRELAEDASNRPKCGGRERRSSYADVTSARARAGKVEKFLNILREKSIHHLVG